MKSLNLLVVFILMVYSVSFPYFVSASEGDAEQPEWINDVSFDSNVFSKNYNQENGELTIEQTKYKTGSVINFQDIQISPSQVSELKIKVNSTTENKEISLSKGSIKVGALEFKDIENAKFVVDSKGKILSAEFKTKETDSGKEYQFANGVEIASSGSLNINYDGEKNTLSWTGDDNSKVGFYSGDRFVAINKDGSINYDNDGNIESVGFDKSGLVVDDRFEFYGNGESKIFFGNQVELPSGKYAIIENDNIKFSGMQFYDSNNLRVWGTEGESFSYDSKNYILSSVGSDHDETIMSICGNIYQNGRVGSDDSSDPTLGISGDSDIPRPIILSMGDKKVQFVSPGVFAAVSKNSIVERVTLSDEEVMEQFVRAARNHNDRMRSKAVLIDDPSSPVTWQDRLIGYGTVAFLGTGLFFLVKNSFDKKDLKKECSKLYKQERDGEIVMTSRQKQKCRGV